MSNRYRICKCNIKNHSPYFIIKDNVLYSSDMSILIAYMAGQTCFSIPQSVTIIGDSAFCGCSSLLSISIPKGVTSIGNIAFGFCESLESINIPREAISIGAGVFFRCFSLKKIIIPKGCKKKFEKMLPDYKNELIEV